MNSKAGIALAAVLLILVAGFFLMKNQNPATQTSENTVTTEASPAAGEEKQEEMSIKSILETGRAQKCTYSSSSTDIKSEGTVYTTAGKMRGDFAGTMNGQTTTSHMIVDGKDTYMWVDGQKTGYKMDLEELDQDPAPSGAGKTTEDKAAQYKMDLDQKMDYTCESWNVDNSKFVIPTDVKFTSLSNMMKDLKGTQCAVCNQMTGEEQAQCKKSLNCM